MSRDNVIQIVIGILGAICTIIAAFIGIKHGENKQNEIVQSQIANVNGDGNTVTMNDVNDLVNSYNDLIEENETLKEQNEQYFNDYKTIKEEKDSLQEEKNSLTTQLQDSPDIQFKNLGLCINGKNININKKNSHVVINGVDYFSKDFVNSLVDKNTSIAIKDDTMYLGRIVADKEKLFSQRVVDSYGFKIIDSITDSYGNTHSNAGKFSYSNSVVYFNLNEKFSLLRLKIAIDETSYSDYTGIITIIADEEIVYTSDELDKVKTNEIVEEDIHVNNCTLLEIRFEGEGGIYPIIYDAEVYN